MDNLIAQEWTDHAYTTIRSLVRGPILEKLAAHADRRVACGNFLADNQVPGAPAVGYDPVMDKLLVLLQPVIENLTSLQLFWTYSYFRVYRRGDALKRHTDRPSCEITLSLNLAYEGGEPWPLWVQGRNGPAALTLGPGDAALYRGIECAHWREPLKGERCVQVFLHYVDQNGPYAEWKYDKRGDLLGMPSLTANTPAKAG
jgi:hypothetical protein